MTNISPVVVSMYYPASRIVTPAVYIRNDPAMYFLNQHPSLIIITISRILGIFRAFYGEKYLKLITTVFVIFSVVVLRKSGLNSAVEHFGIPLWRFCVILTKYNRIEDYCKFVIYFLSRPNYCKIKLQIVIDGEMFQQVSR